MLSRAAGISITETIPTWQAENDTQVSRFSAFFFSLLTAPYKSADTTNHTSVESKMLSKRSNCTAYEDKFIVSCCKINDQANSIFLVLRVTRLSFWKMPLFSSYLQITAPLTLLNFSYPPMGDE